MSRRYHVYYQTQKSCGEIEITQNHYVPITSDILDDVRRIIREQNNMPKDETIVICYWQRFEGEDDDDE